MVVASSGMIWLWFRFSGTTRIKLKYVCSFAVLSFGGFVKAFELEQWPETVFDLEAKAS